MLGGGHRELGLGKLNRELRQEIIESTGRASPGNWVAAVLTPGQGRKQEALLRRIHGLLCH